MLSPKDLVQAEEGGGVYRWFIVEPSILYPNALRDLVRIGEMTEEDSVLAMTPRDGLTDPYLLWKRSFCLERARLHFLNTLIEQVGVGVGLHITKDLAWAL